MSILRGVSLYVVVTLGTSNLATSAMAGSRCKEVEEGGKKGRGRDGEKMVVANKVEHDAFTRRVLCV